MFFKSLLMKLGITAANAASDTATDAVTSAKESIELFFEPMNFVNNLDLLIAGMIGIFIIIGVIIIATALLNAITNKIARKKKDK